MLVNGIDIINKAYKEGYAIGAYNVNNIEWAKVILEACQDDKAPVILAFTENAVKYIGGYGVAVSIVKSLIKDQNIDIPVVIHLDHAKSFESCKRAIDSGFTSVMIDASDKDFNENEEIVSKVAKYAHDKNVAVESELGNIDTNTLCTAYDCKEYVINTGIDFLAPAIGNKHGFYSSLDELEYNLLGEICKEVKIPLVLHGGSFLDNNKINTAIFCGVSKININTELQDAWAKAVKEYLKNNPDEYDPRKIIGSGISAIKKKVHEKNIIFGSKM